MGRVYHNTESYIALVNKVHEDKYDYSKTVFVKMKDKVTVICREHGEFYPVALNHKKTGCPHCYDGRRGTSLKMTRLHFTSRLNNKYTLVSPFQGGKKEVTLLCKEHGVFQGLPTRVLMRKFPCKGCKADNMASINRGKAQPKVRAALDSLPAHISCLEKLPSWGSFSKLTCKYHGPFNAKLKEASTYTFVCNKCAVENKKGIGRVSYEQYSSFLQKLFPSPPFALTLDEEAYSKGVGTKLVLLNCEKHGKFSRHRSTVNNGKLGTPCPYCKVSGASTLEGEVVEFVRTLGPCVQGDRKQIAPKELDCFVPSKKLAIEFNGLYWHSEAKIDKTYHKNKNNLCRDKGIDLIQIFEDEWVNKKEICKSIISNRMGMNSSVFYGRKLSVIPCDFKVARDFLNANHIQGFVPAQRYFTLVDLDGTVRAVASFSFNRLKKDGSWELVRYCSVLSTNVVGGLPKLVKHFLKAEGVTRLISYCCLRWFNGEGYKKAGFTLLSEGPPSYFYTNKQIRYSRHVAKKHKLRRLLPSFDENMTESENMAAAKFLKIYDCGNLLFEFKL